MVIMFDDWEYRKSHCRRPRGYGLWLFEITDGLNYKDTFEVHGNLTTAKEECRKYIRKTVSRDVLGVTVNVCP